jgi:hypothetical protein
MVASYTVRHTLPDEVLGSSGSERIMFDLCKHSRIQHMKFEGSNIQCHLGWAALVRILFALK